MNKKIISFPQLSDEGTLGAIPYAVLVLVIFALVFLAMGVVVDEVIRVENTLMNDSVIPYSLQKHDTMEFLAACFKAMSFIAVLVVIIFLIMNGVQKRSGVV